MHYLEIPQEVLNRADAYELVRFWVCDGQDFVSLNVDLFGDNEARAWGSVAADLIKHAVLGMALVDPEKNPAELRDEMVRAFNERISEQGDYSGRLGL